MHFVYLLRSSKDGNFYIGQTDHLDLRISSHNDGLVDSTKYRRPLELVYYEAYESKTQAIERELKLKDFGSAYSGLLRRLGFT